MLYTGGPAFPVGNVNGMTLRDYFAAKAMQGLVSDPDLVLDAIQTAQLSYKYADAMLEARQK
jgi:hypothetical protein